METFSALLAFCAGNSPVPGEFPPQRPVTRGFDVFFDLCPNKRLSKQWWGWWFETLSCSLWRHSNDWYKKRFGMILCEQLAERLKTLCICIFWLPSINILTNLLPIVVCYVNLVCKHEWTSRLRKQLKKNLFFCIVNAMAADGLATHGSRTSAAMVLSQFSRIVVLELLSP